MIVEVVTRLMIFGGLLFLPIVMVVASDGQATAWFVLIVCAGLSGYLLFVDLRNHWHSDKRKGRSRTAR